MKSCSKKNLEDRPRVYAVDLFCGAGGLTHGLERSGIRVRLGIDIDPACEYPYSQNNDANFLLKPIEKVEKADISKALPKIGVSMLAGCAPCQTFSTYYQKAKKSDKRWHLLSRFAKLTLEVRPDIVTMENVPRLTEFPVFQRFVKKLKDAGYSVNYTVINCGDYGLPQSRNRLVFLASLFGPISIVTPSQQKTARTVSEAISHLPALNAGESWAPDPLHQCSELSPLNLKRIRASKPGGSWRDWNKKLVADCHKKSTGKTYPSVYGRMNWDEPAPTITTQFFGFGNGRFGHPIQDRAISLREGAILQGFPEDYEFVPLGKPISKKGVGRLIGNAVPVTLGELIGESIFEHLSQYPRRQRAQSPRTAVHG